MNLGYQDLKRIDVTQVSFGVTDDGISHEKFAYFLTRITERSSFLDTSVP